MSTKYGIVSFVLESGGIKKIYFLMIKIYVRECRLRLLMLLIHLDIEDCIQ